MALQLESPVILDDKTSFLIEVERAETFVDYESLSRLMNEYVFAFDGTPVTDLEITQEEDADQRDLVAIRGYNATMASFDPKASERIDDGHNHRTRRESRIQD